MPEIRGRVISIAVAQTALHHGDKRDGNTVSFRKHPVQVDGRQELVPFISGNSMKHQNREAGTMFALSAMGLADPDNDEGISEAELHLLLSGGTLEGAQGNQKLAEARQAEAIIPSLGLHGYAAGNVMQESQVRVDHLEMVCDATAHKYADIIEEHAPELADALQTPAAQYLEEHWGTNHEPTRRRKFRDLLHPDVRDGVESRPTSGADKKKSTQMIYSHECVIPGAVFVGGYTFTAGIRQVELQAFRSAFSYASEGEGPSGGILMRVGAKSGQGFGLVEMRLFGQLAEGIEQPEFVDTDALVPDQVEGYDDDMRGYIDYLRARRDDMDVLAEFAS